MTSSAPGSCVTGTSEMAKRIREHDWAATPVGPIEEWPQSLQTMVELMLASGFPMIILWGPDLIQLYNDGYRDIMNGKHPGGLGQPTQECWPEVWHLNAPIYDRVWAGQTVTLADGHYPLMRRGVMEDAWFTLSYSPLRVQPDEIGGVLVTLVETTERVQAEREMKASGARYQALTSAASDAIFRMSSDWTDMLEMDGRGFLADASSPTSTWLDIYVAPDDKASVSAMIAQGVRSGTPFDLEHQVWRADGSLGWVHSRSVPVRNERGTITEWVGAATDISDRKLNEAAMQRSARWTQAQNDAFQAAMDGSPLAISLDILARLVHEETGGEARTAFYLADAEGAHLHPVRNAGTMPDAYLDAVDGFLIGEDSLSCGLAVPTGQPILTPDVHTEPRWARWVDMAETFDFRGCWSFPIKTRDRLAVGTFAMYFREERAPTADDMELAATVTQAAAVIIAHHVVGEERLTAERELQASEERYRLILDQATDYAIFSADRDRRIETWPTGAAAVFGWTADEAIGQLIDITYPLDDRIRGVPEQEMAEARDTGHAPNVRWHVRKDGTYVFIEGDAYARRDANGIFQGVFKIGQDVTARLAAEEAQREEDAACREEEAILREELEIQVRAATNELRQLSRRLLAVQEEERRRLALELHDEVGQVLTALNFQLAAAQGIDESVSLAEAQTTVQALTEQVRQLSLDLRPAVLDRYGLLVALEWHIDRFRAQTGITVHLRHQGLNQRFAPEVEITAFRVVQEALTNVARHSGEHFATVQVYGDGSLTLVIRDAGRGFDPASAGPSTGIGGMRERVELLGGRLQVEARPGDGTAIIAEIPAELPEDES